jgi:hypothetical protein
VETGHEIRQAIAATADSSCDGAVAVTLVFGCGTASGNGSEAGVSERSWAKIYACYIFIFSLFHI